MQSVLWHFLSNNTTTLPLPMNIVIYNTVSEPYKHLCRTSTIYIFCLSLIVKFITFFAMIKSKSMIFIDFIILVKQYPKDFPTQEK